MATRPAIGVHISHSKGLQPLRVPPTTAHKDTGHRRGGMAMQWFYNLQLKAKLITGFLVVAVIAAIIGAVGIYDIREIDAASDKLYEKMTVPLGELADISVSFQRVRINLRDAVGADTAEERAAAAETLKKLRDGIAKASESFEKTILTDEGRSAFAEFKEARNRYGAVIEKALNLAAAGKQGEAESLMK
ncbi:MAG TPA: MCP four helix bundle domain-containing protein, partial [Desulfurivibrionaceae bacterium]|nr:MCP four helix bundle domain-containing protein [Desulfurivibrionaceae bacterium]